MGIYVWSYCLSTHPTCCSSHCNVFILSYLLCLLFRPPAINLSCLIRRPIALFKIVWYQNQMEWYFYGYVLSRNCFTSFTSTISSCYSIVLFPMTLWRWVRILIVIVFVYVSLYCVSISLSPINFLVLPLWFHCPTYFISCHCLYMQLN